MLILGLSLCALGLWLHILGNLKFFRSHTKDWAMTGAVLLGALGWVLAIAGLMTLAEGAGWAGAATVAAGWFVLGVLNLVAVFVRAGGML